MDCERLPVAFLYADVRAYCSQHMVKCIVRGHVRPLIHDSSFHFISFHLLQYLYKRLFRKKARKLKIKVFLAFHENSHISLTWHQCW